MKKRFETCTVTLTPLSPIHISSGNSDYGWGAVWIEKTEKMYILDSERLSQKLIECNLFEKYIEEVERWIYMSDSQKEKQSNPCLKFLEDHKAQLFPDVDIIRFVKDLSTTELNAKSGSRFIRDGEGRAYIPGSSIKGAIRTAVIYAMLAENRKREKKDYLNLYGIYSPKLCFVKDKSVIIEHIYS
ncbi:type III-A CRISPR-associated RAMP protein Csm5 [Chlorobaculum sp. 24CR]|uniref:type III-A CRISPR-associated RAMP protein Csm5 n=1 Tax=Chlorobaculum sp. 24CR TaxID=2508878 RepID=UPI00100B2D69|nr:type III-A CRISPR-associated RAMP protein Csm5 [Chlorobaculum sp. 24CR]RXK80700.1 type III-A CRISPR-associated RAMP protein Csm5 [Chlorobaculum sp. 24CR]